MCFLGVRVYETITAEQVGNFTASPLSAIAVESLRRARGSFEVLSVLTPSAAMIS